MSHDVCVKLDFSRPHDSGVYMDMEQVIDVKKAREGGYTPGLQLTVAGEPPTHVSLELSQHMNAATNMLEPCKLGISYKTKVPDSVRNKFKFDLHAVYIGIPAVEGEWDSASNTYSNPEYQEWYHQVKAELSAQELHLLQQPNEACVILSLEDRKAWTCKIKLMTVTEFAANRPISRKNVKHSDEDKAVMWKALHAIGRTGAYCPIMFNSETFAISCCSKMRLTSCKGQWGWSQQSDYLVVEMMPYTKELCVLGAGMAGACAVTAAAQAGLFTVKEAVVKQVVTKVPGFIWGAYSKTSWVAGTVTRTLTVQEVLAASAPSICAGAVVAGVGICLAANYFIRQSQLTSVKKLLDDELEGMNSTAKDEQAKLDKALQFKRARRQQLTTSLRIGQGKFNFAFCGETGVGKSTCINALLQSDEATKFLAAVSNLGEGTLEIERHEDALFTLFDVPGAGTKLHPAQTYFEDKVLDCFDGVMVFIRAGRQKEFDIKLISRLLFENKDRVAIVCGRVNESIEELSPNDPDKAMKEIRAVLLNTENGRSLKVQVEHELRQTYSSDIKLTENLLFLIDQKSWMMENSCKYDESLLLAWMIRCKFRFSSDASINEILKRRNMPTITNVLAVTDRNGLTIQTKTKHALNNSSVVLEIPQQLQINSLRNKFWLMRDVLGQIKRKYLW